MSSLLEFDASRIEDISREPKVSRKDLPREITHTITMVPTNYLNSLWPDVRDQLARAVKRSQGRLNMEFLYASILGDTGDTAIDFTWGGREGLVKTAAGSTGDLVITTTSAASADEITLVIHYAVR